jgi:hypothetical protein
MATPFSDDGPRQHDQAEAPASAVIVGEASDHDPSRFYRVFYRVLANILTIDVADLVVAKVTRGDRELFVRADK